MTDDEMHGAFVGWLNGLLVPPVLKAYPEEPLLDTAHVVVNFVKSIEVRAHAQFVDYDNVEFGDPDPVTATPQIETEWHFSVHAYGLSRIDPATNTLRSPAPATPMDILRPLRAAAQLAQINEPLMPGTTVHEVSAIRNVPDWVNNKWRARAQCDIYLRGIVKDGFVIDVIEETSFLYVRI